MFDWFFAEETLRVLLTTLLGSAAAIFSAFIASRNVSKTIRNQNKGLPPELLRLEKIQEIITNHDSAPILKDVDATGLKAEYKKAMHRSILESQLGSLGIQDEYSRRKLIFIPEKIKDIYSFPDLNTLHGTKMDKISRIIGQFLAIVAIIPLLITIIITVFVLGYISYLLVNYNPVPLLEILVRLQILPFFVACSLFLCFLARSIINRTASLIDIETDLIVRNVYQHYSEYFTGADLVVKENESELKRRVIFENSKKFKKWQENNPDKSSWDYGFNPDSPLAPHKIEDAVPVGCKVAANKIVFIPLHFIFTTRGRKIVKSKPGKHLSVEQIEYYI